MGIQIEFKSPDGCWAYITQAVPGDGDDPKVEKAREKLSAKFFEHGEYGRVELDPKTGTATLIPLSRWR